MILPFYIFNSKNIHISGISIDWQAPLYIQGEILGYSEEDGYYDVRLHKEGYDWEISRYGYLKFPTYSPYSTVGESLVFDKERNAPIYGSNKYDIHRKGEDVVTTRLDDGTIRIHEKLKNYPPIGSIINFKGPNGENRYSPAFYAKNSTDIKLDDINIFHAPGMGILCEKVENAYFDKINIVVPKDSDRTVSVTADATHFCNCKGEVIIENSIFENMLDDGTNVHGTYVEVAEILDERTIRTKLHHPQQGGFIFAEAGDEVYFITSPKPTRDKFGEVASVQEINEFYTDITFKEPIPENLAACDILENKTWNTSLFKIENCTIRNNRARNIVLKTPGKIIISSNRFSSMMASILIRNEMSFWYESGAVEDVLIENNVFEDCVTGCTDTGVILISARVSKHFKEMPIDKNIRIINNKFHTFDNILVQAKDVDGLTIKNNSYRRTNTFKPYNIDAAAISVERCTNVNIEDNHLPKDTKVKINQKLK